MKTKVFGVGLNKTGTTTLTDALGLLGWRSLHHDVPGLRDRRLSALVERAVDRGHHPFRYTPPLRLFDAFFDVRAVEKHFVAFARAYPDAKFILHVRDKEAWLDSREKHVRRSIEAGIEGWTTIDRETWAREWDEQLATVRQRFATETRRLLEIDVTRHARWDELCEFLDVTLPDADFPHRNASARD